MKPNMGDMCEMAGKSAKNGITEGVIWKQILIFFFPILIGTFFQQLYNTVDAVVVGRFAGKEALSSVGGSSSQIINFVVGFFTGLSAGSTVIIAQYYGAKNRDGLHRALHTAYAFSAVFGILAGIIGVFATPAILRMMKTPDNLMADSELYVQIYFSGLIFICIYNIGSAILRAIGDSKRPLYYLAIAGVLNVLLNLFFVIVFHMAAAGVATATAIAQYVSAGLIMIHLVRRKDECHVSLKNIRFHRDAGVQVLMIGIPAGIQSAVFAIANLFVQAGVNSFNTITVSGNAAATNADSLIFNVLYAFYTGCSSFMSQNFGARNKKRVLKSYFVCLFYSFFASVLLGVLLFVFGHQFLSLFATDAAVIDAGMQRIRIMAFSYAVSVFMDCTTAASRGIGKTIVPTIIILLGSCAFRIIWIYTIFAWIHTIPSLYLLYVFSWLITSAAEIIYFIISYRKLKC